LQHLAGGAGICQGSPATQALQQSPLRHGGCACPAPDSKRFPTQHPRGWLPAFYCCAVSCAVLESSPKLVQCKGRVLSAGSTRCSHVCAESTCLQPHGHCISLSCFRRQRSAGVTGT
jgi:hypothetical protein